MHRQTSVPASIRSKNAWRPRGRISKATDEAGHTKDPAEKQRTIEALDAELGTLPTERAIVCVTGDHATPTYADVIHSGPLPFLLAGLGVRPDPVESFGELDCAGGILGHLRGPDMMPVLLNAADRPLFLGRARRRFPAPTATRKCWSRCARWQSASAPSQSPPPRRST